MEKMRITDNDETKSIGQEEAAYKKTIIRIRRGFGQARYCACDDAGNPIRGFKKLSDIRRHWRNEIKWGRVELVRELDKTPDVRAVKDIIECIDTILKSYKKGKAHLEENKESTVNKAIKKLSDYEDLEEQGLLLKLPCAVGQNVYEVYRFLDEGALEIDVHKIRLEDLEKIGDTVFLTRAEAEEALRTKQTKNGTTNNK